MDWNFSSTKYVHYAFHSKKMDCFNLYRLLWAAKVKVKNVTVLIRVLNLPFLGSSKLML